MKTKDMVNAQFRLPGLAGVWGGPNPFDMIEQAELPVTVKQVIRSVVKSSRLWRGEKLEVANELLAHFEDGLRGGKEAEKLIRDFGDPVVAAQLIRSSKIRNRSMNTKLLYGGLWGFLLFVMTYFGLTAFYHAGKANPSHDYTADLNEPALSIPPEDAAWPIYRPVFTKFGFSEGGDGKFGEIFVESEKPGQTLATPQDGEAWDTAIKKLNESSELLNAFRVARLKSALGLPLYADTSRYSDEDFSALFPKRKREDNTNFEFSSADSQEILDKSMIAILLPHYQVFRTATRILIVDSRWAIEQDDFERVTQNVESVFGFSRQLGNEAVLVGDLLAYAIQTQGFDLIDELLPKHLGGFSDDQLLRMQTAITNSNPAEMIDYASERYLALDIFQRCFTDDGNGDGRITANGYELIRNFDKLFNSQQAALGLQEQFANTWQTFTKPFALMQFPSRKETERDYLALMKANEEELKRPFYAAASLRPDSKPDDEANPFWNSLFPATQQVGTAMFRTKSQQEATSTTIAIYRYQKQTGKLPNSLVDLKGTLLQELPVDQFDGQTLRYQKKDDGFILYSIGNDRIDNHGERKLISADNTKESLPKDRPEPAGLFNMSGNEKGFDWVLWPRMSNHDK